MDDGMQAETDSNRKGLAMTTAVKENRRAMPKPNKEPDAAKYSGRIAVSIRATRERAGMSVEELAVRVSQAGYIVASPTLYHWENGNRRPDLDALPFIAKALRVPLMELLPPK
jgi:ribosome-binding protein aMBF1 (putative translation factor)